MMEAVTSEMGDGRWEMEGDCGIKAEKLKS